MPRGQNEYLGKRLEALLGHPTLMYCSGPNAFLSALGRFGLPEVLGLGGRGWYSALVLRLRSGYDDGRLSFMGSRW